MKATKPVSQSAQWKYFISKSTLSFTKFLGSLYTCSNDATTSLSLSLFLVFFFYKSHLVPIKTKANNKKILFFVVTLELIPSPTVFPSLTTHLT